MTNEDFPKRGGFFLSYRADFEKHGLCWIFFYKLKLGKIAISNPVWQPIDVSAQRRDCIIKLILSNFSYNSLFFLILFFFDKQAL